MLLWWWLVLRRVVVVLWPVSVCGATWEGLVRSRVCVVVVQLELVVVAHVIWVYVVLWGEVVPLGVVVVVVCGTWLRWW